MSNSIIDNEAPEINNSIDCPICKDDFRLCPKCLDIHKNNPYIIVVPEEEGLCMSDKKLTIYEAIKEGKTISEHIKETMDFLDKEDMERDVKLIIEDVEKMN